jgi:hypothetical protein
MEEKSSCIGLKEYFEKIIDIRFKGSEDALILSREVLGKDLHRMNELRVGYESERQHFVRNERYEPEHKILTDQIKGLSEKILVMETRTDRKNMYMWIALGVSIFVSLISLIKEFIK